MPYWQVSIHIFPPPSRRLYAFDLLELLMQVGVVVTSKDRLQEFIEASQDNPELGLSVEEFTLRVREPLPPTSLRQSLSIVPLITDLVLCVAPDTATDVLDELRFPYLQLFKTNLPHSRITRFLSAHRSVTDLCLDTCGHRSGKTCPLRALDLGHIATLECSIDCIAGVAHTSLLRLTAESQRGSPYTSTILKSLKGPSPSLFSLTLDVCVDDYDILQGVIRCAPMVEKLKLLERLPSNQVSYVVCRLLSSGTD